MSTSRPAAWTFPPVAETAQLAGLGDEERALAEEATAPRPFLRLLLEAGKYGDMVRYLAFALPKREAVWWACRCARLAPEMPRPGDRATALAALVAAERWVRDPSEENRRNCGVAGEAAVATPGGCAALAAFWSGGSLAPKGLPDVPPAPDLTARGVAAGVMLSGVISAPEKAPERYRAFHDLGLAVADGADHWAKAPAPGPAPTAPSPTPAKAAPPSQPAPAPPPRPTPSTRYRDTWE